MTTEASPTDDYIHWHDEKDKGRGREWVMRDLQQKSGDGYADGGFDESRTAPHPTLAPGGARNICPYAFPS